MRTMKGITRRLLSPLTFVVIVVLGLLCPAPAGATGLLDQSQTVSMSPFTVSVSPRAQVFTAGRYGSLDRVSLYVENWAASSPAGAVLNVSVQTVIEGLPSGKQIGSGSIPLTDIPSPNFRNWVDVSISGAVVNAGTQYALVLQTNSVFAKVNWWYGYTSYVGSLLHFDGTAWQTVYPGDNFAFKTYVVPDTLDQYQRLGDANWRSICNGTIAQLFTAGVRGTLDRVRVNVANENANGIEASIQTVTGGIPSGTVLGRGWIPASYIPEPGLDNWVTIGVGGVVVEADTQYALVLRSGWGHFCWDVRLGDGYLGGDMMWPIPDWTLVVLSGKKTDAKFETYIAIPPPTAVQSRPPTITPCSSGVCPAVVGSITPADSIARVTSNVAFPQLRDGRVHGILHFDDSRTGDFVLRGCTTDSAACRLTVTTLACTDQHAITVAGSYTPKGGSAGRYWLTLSGTRGGIGTFTLTAGDYTYTLTHNGIVDVTCPPL